MTSLGPQVEHDLVSALRTIGRRARAATGAEDLALLQVLKWSTRAAEIGARIVLVLGSGPWAWLIGTAALAYDLSVEAQLNHSIMHGAFARIPGAGRFTPARYETLAIPFQSKTWGDAHGIHHGSPSILGEDPDTLHPLFRVHESSPYRPWHVFNAFVGALFTFEWWAFDYDRFLKKKGLRRANDRGEIKKFIAYVIYQCVLFPVLAGDRWLTVLLAGLVAISVRNLIFTGLQLASSVGTEVSTAHATLPARPLHEEACRFQIETSKNFRLGPLSRLLCGGLDRHIEHHLFPYLPPSRLAAVSRETLTLARAHRIRYAEYPSVWQSLGDSLRHLARLSRSR